jgi:hypothetical protein
VIEIAKLQNDKYYTPIELANYCWDKVFEIVGEENISEIIEPSVGNGSFFIIKNSYRILLMILNRNVNRILLAYLKPIT